MCGGRWAFTYRTPRLILSRNPRPFALCRASVHFRTEVLPAPSLSAARASTTLRSLEIAVKVAHGFCLRRLVLPGRVLRGGHLRRDLRLPRAEALPRVVAQHERLAVDDHL